MNTFLCKFCDYYHGNYYLLKELQNYNLDLVIEVNELQVKRYAYTDKEKYEKLVEKNPNLEALRRAFELDI